MMAAPTSRQGILPPAALPARPPVQWNNIAKTLGLIVLTCLCYAPSLGGSFLWDDDLLVTNDPLVQSVSGLRRIWFSAEPYDYFPLTYTSFWLEWPLWGADPLGYRVVNLLLHLLSAFLFWRLLTRLRLPGAWFGALLFAVHPLNVASVAWIAERKNTLSMAFCLATLLCWVESEDRPVDARGRARWYLAALAAFVLAALSKSSVVMLPTVLLLVVWWRRGTLRRIDLSRAAPFFGVSLAAGLLTIWFQFHRSMDPGWQRTVAPPLVRVLIAGRAMGFYLVKTLLPTRLSMIYPRWEVNVASPLAWLPLVAVLALLFAAWQVRTRWGRGPLTALGACTLMALPISGIVPMSFSMYSFVSDHFVYVPLLGLLAGMAAGLTIWAGQGGTVTRRLALGVMTLLAAAFIVTSMGRAEQFSSSRRLWGSTLAINPGSAIAYNNFGLAVEDTGRLAEAESQYRRALDFNPTLPAALTNLARVLQRQGRWSEAAAAYTAALKQNPSAKDFNNYGVVLLQLGESDAAREQFYSASRMEPAMLSPHFNLYRLALSAADQTKAIAALRDCLRIDPDDVPSLLALAACEIKVGPRAGNTEPVMLAERANQLTNGADAVALGTLSRAYLAAGRRDDAIHAGEQAQAAAVRRRQPELSAEIDRYLTGLHAAGR